MWYLRRVDGAKATPGDGSPRMFDAIAPRYDLLNRLMSLGLDRAWRRAAVDAMDLGAGRRGLDLATGTGDLVIDAAARFPDATLVGADPSLGMLRIARRKGDGGPVLLAAGDALCLPFRSAVFDAVAIAFGIRNVPDRAAGLREMARVVRPGGRVVILELARPVGHPLAPLARIWVRWIVPMLGGIVSSAAAYRYLRTSMSGFPPPERFREMMEEAGLEQVTLRTLAPGACHLFMGRVSEPRDTVPRGDDSGGGET